MKSTPMMVRMSMWTLGCSGGSGVFSEWGVCGLHFARLDSASVLSERLRHTQARGSLKNSPLVFF